MTDRRFTHRLESGPAMAAPSPRRRALLTLGARGALGMTAIAAIALLAPVARAQEMSNTLPDLIDRSRQAVVAVGTFAATDSPRFGFRGTGFAVGDGRRIVTCAHVIPNPLEQDLMITVPAGANASGQPQLRPVKLLRRDAAHDPCPPARTRRVSRSCGRSSCCAATRRTIWRCSNWPTTRAR